MRVQIMFLPRFLKEMKRLERALQEEAVEKIGLFKDSANHRALKVHRLHGPLKGRYSFSINYRYRIVFKYISKSEVAFLTVGDHAIYQ